MWFGTLLDVRKVNFSEIKENDVFLETIEDSVNTEISRYCQPDGVVLGNDIIKECFPSISADVFISHSHNDEAYAKKVASFLYGCGLHPFLDSCVWKSADSLLKKIDDKFCYNVNSKTYNYNARNLSTSYVHMMLTSAICNMIDRCPLFLFISSENSLDLQNIQRNKTLSPWLFFELLFFHKVCPKIPARSSNFSRLRKQATIAESSENLKIVLPVEIRNLQELSVELIDSWARFCKTTMDTNKKLEFLYKLLYEHS